MPYCVIITSWATNQSREFSFFTYVITLTIDNTSKRHHYLPDWKVCARDFIQGKSKLRNREPLQNTNFPGRTTGH